MVREKIQLNKIELPQTIKNKLSLKETLKMFEKNLKNKNIKKAAENLEWAARICETEGEYKTSADFFVNASKLNLLSGEKGKEIKNLQEIERMQRLHEIQETQKPVQLYPETKLKKLKNKIRKIIK